MPNDQQIAQEMFLGRVDPGIKQRGEVAGQREVGRGRHGGTPRGWSPEIFQVHPELRINLEHFAKFIGEFRGHGLFANQ